MNRITSTFLSLVVLCTPAFGQCYEVVWVQCGPGGCPTCPPQYYQQPYYNVPQPYQANPKVHPDGVQTPPVGSPGTPRFVPQPVPVTPRQPAQPPLVPVKPIPKADDAEAKAIAAALVKIELRLSAIEAKQGEPGPKGETGPQGPPGPPGNNADASFQIRVRNPRTGYTTPYATVKNGGQVTLILDPAQLGEK